MPTRPSKRFRLLLLLAPMVLLSACLPDRHPEGYNLVFRDEFDTVDLDRDLWCTRYIYGGGPSLQVPDAECQRNGDGNLDFLNDEQQRYVDTNRKGEKMHVQQYGNLSMRATKTRTNDGYASYESAMIRSKDVFRPTASKSYYIVARVKMPETVGTWPAFWINSDRRNDGTTTWPPEVDFFDGALNGKDDRAEMLHQAAIIKGKQTNSGNTEFTYTNADYDRQWKNYHADASLRGRWVEIGAEWTVNGVCYFVDDVKTMCENYKWVYNDGTQAAPAHILLNLAIGGQWAGRYGIDDSGIPTSFDIDFVRVYEKS